MTCVRPEGHFMAGAWPAAADFSSNFCRRSSSSAVIFSLLADPRDGHAEMSPNTVEKPIKNISR